MANVRNDTISIDFDHFVHIELFLPRYKTEYHLVFTPFTVFTFSGQSPCSSVIRGEAPPKKITRHISNRKHGAYLRQALFIQSVRTVRKGLLHNT